MQEQAKPYIVPPCHEEVKILHQDEHLLLVNKPDLLLSIPGRHPLNKDCLISRLQEIYPEARTVHRLDLDTSGIMIVPLSKAVQGHIGKQFEARTVHKEYTAVVYGLVEQDQGSVDLPIICDWENRPLQKIDHENGKHALTHYEVLERSESDNCTRLLLKPVTGRSHQLRIHMRELGHPILGCDMYAHDEAFHMAKRLMLHATRIDFEHPISLERIYGHSPVPF